MNLKRLQSAAELLRLRLRVGLTWLIVELEPAGSTERRSLMADYKTANHQYNQALLRQREARMNRRAF
ncbi:hypothetical protein [Marinobacter sp.]|uniref:hypothetical protein n=1 Tax=Marinobacter sp. TaxID=50741 RepID=UPI0035C6F985